MMGAAENKQLLKSIFDDLAQGNAERFAASMAEDFRWRIPGATKWSRTYEGKQAVLKELFGPLMARIEGKLKTRAHRFIVEGDYVVVEARGDNNITKSGARYNNEYCFVIRVADGKLKELTEYMDTALVNSVFEEEGVL